MSRLLVRTWCAEGGHDGAGWSRTQVDRFEALMREASVKARGLPALVTAWDDGRGCVCWYEAHAGPAETALRDRVRAVFGVHERRGT